MTRTAETRRTRPVASPPVAGLAGLPVGPRLAVALAALEVTSLSGFDLVLVLRARSRQDNHDRGMVLATVGEIMRRKDPGFGRVDDPVDDDDESILANLASQGRDEVGANEIRAALMLTRRSANRLAGLARDLVVRLPAVLHAMICGDLDQARATIFSVWTAELCDRHAHAVVDALLPLAPRLTTAQLIDAIQKAAIDLDPEWARRRYENALKARSVRGTINPDGTAELTGTNLPADEVAAACDRIDALAHRVKQAGHPGLINHIAADIFLGRNGQYVGMDDDQLFAHLVATMPAPTTATDTATDTESTGNPEAGTAAGGDTGNGATGDDTDSTVDTATDSRLCSPAGSASAVTTPSGRSDDEDHDEPPHEPGRDTPDGDPVPPDDRSDGPGGGTGDPVGPPSAGNARHGATTGRRPGRGLRLLVGLGTIAGRDRRPGELLGFGFVHAELARRLSAARHASWWYALTTPDGQPLDIGPIRRRPTIAWTDTPTPAAGVVEVWLQLTPDELARLTHDPPPGWEALFADLAHRIANNPGGAPNGDPTDRLPNAALRRWIGIRDRRCVFPGCRAPAHRCDADHTTEHGRGGPTVDANLGNACGPDHDLRHTRGWRVAQPQPGHFVWTSPLGHTYERMPPVLPTLALPSMPVPTDPRRDRFFIWVSEKIDYFGNETCKYVVTPVPPGPDPEPEPAPHDPTVEVPPF